MPFERWEIFLSPRFLAAFLIVLGAFLPMVYSIFRTWMGEGAGAE